MSHHTRNIASMRASPRCGAHTRAGTPCQNPAVAGKARCRMHGGGAGSGAPNGNQNALKHGFYRAAAMEQRRQIQELSRQARRTLRELAE